MDSNLPPVSPPPPPPPPPRSYSPPVSSPGVFGTRIPSSVSFVVGLLLFLLPFAQLKCNGSVLAQNSGLGIALGAEWKVSGMSTGGLFGNDEIGESKAMQKKQDPNLYAIVAMALAALGLILSFANGKSAGFGGLVTGVLSAGALIGLMIDLKSDPQLKDAGSRTKTGNVGLETFGDIRVGLEFTPWFYIAIIAFLAAAFFSYRRTIGAK